MGKGRKRRQRAKKKTAEYLGTSAKAPGQQIELPAPRLMTLDLLDESSDSKPVQSVSAEGNTQKGSVGPVSKGIAIHKDRKFERVPCSRPIQIASGWTHMFSDECIADLSPDGVFVETDRLLCRQDPVIVRIYSRLGRWLEVHGRVRWANPAIGSSEKQSGMGIQFSTITEDIQKEIQAILGTQAQSSVL